MKRYVIISHNNDPLYSFFEPIVKWCWEKMGYICLCPVLESPIESQLYRLFATHASLIDKDDYIMTSDVDMLPLNKEYFNQQDLTKDVHLFGQDLCGYNLQPICYIGMKKKFWDLIIDEDYKEVLAAWNNIKDRERQWDYDQQFFWIKFNEHKHKVSYQLIDRGTIKNGLPIGRVDRYAWSLDHDKFIDCHMLRPGYEQGAFNKMMELLVRCFPNEDLKWMYEYRERFIREKGV